jgi:biotin operon repressor
MIKEEQMEAIDQVLEAMKAAGEPVAAGKLAEMTGLDRKAVDKAMDALKKTGGIESPVRCKWQPKA